MFFWKEEEPSKSVEISPADRLILYHYNGCYFCMMVRQTIDRLEIEVEYRNIHEDPTHREELLEARGRTTVPVLRGLSKEDDWWMPESRDIIKYLESEFG